MRKFFVVAALGAFLLSIAAPALAIDFTFKGEYRVRMYDFMNWGFDKDNDQRTAATVGNGKLLGAQTNPAAKGNFHNADWRARPRFVVSDDNGNIQAVLRLEIGNTKFGGGGGDNTEGMGNGFGTSAFSVGNTISNNRVGGGSGGAIGSDGMGVKTKWMFIDFAAPFNVPLRVRAGNQAIYLPKGLIVDDDAAGIRLYGEIKPFKYEAAWYRIARGTTTNNNAVTVSGLQSNPGQAENFDNAYDWYYGKMDLALAPWLNPGAYFAYGINKLNCTAGNVEFTGASTAGVNTAGTHLATCDDRARNSYYAGFTITGKLGIVDYDLDGVWGLAEGGPSGAYGNNDRNMVGSVGSLTSGENTPIKVQGFGLDGGIHMPFGPFTFNVVGSYFSGDTQKGPGSTTSLAFPFGIAPSWSGPSQTYSAMAPWEIVGEGGGVGGQEDVLSMNHSPVGLWTAGAYATYNPVKALTMKAGYLFAGFTHKESNCAFVKNGGTTAAAAGPCFGNSFVGKITDSVAGKSYLGHEIDLAAQYTIWTGFSLRGSASWLIPSAGDVLGKYVAYFFYEF